MGVALAVAMAVTAAVAMIVLGARGIAPAIVCELSPWTLSSFVIISTTFSLRFLCLDLAMCFNRISLLLNSPWFTWRCFLNHCSMSQWSLSQWCMRRRLQRILHTRHSQLHITKTLCNKVIPSQSTPVEWRNTSKLNLDSESNRGIDPPHFD